MTKRERFFARLSPPGYELGTERRVFIIGSLCAFLYSLFFLIRCSNARSALFEYQNGVKALLPDVVMPDFTALLGGALLGFPALALCMLIFIALRYAYHRQGGKSVYLMRRLPDPLELHRRCIVLPLLAAVVCLLCAALLLIIYFGLYTAISPRQCIPPGQWRSIWSVTQWLN